MLQLRPETAKLYVTLYNNLNFVFKDSMRLMKILQSNEILMEVRQKQVENAELETKVGEAERKAEDVQARFEDSIQNLDSNEYLLKQLEGTIREQREDILEKEKVISDQEKQIEESKVRLNQVLEAAEGLETELNVVKSEKDLDISDRESEAQD